MPGRNRSYEIRLDGKLATRTLKELDKEASRLRNVLRNMSTESENYGKTVKSYQRVKRAQQENYQQIRKVDKATRQAARANKSFGGSALSAFRKVQRNWLAVTAGVTAFVAAFRGVYRVINRFDQSTANLASILGQTREEMAALTKNAIDLGSTSAFTASEVQDLQIELAKLGFVESQILDMTEAVINFSVTTGSDVPEAAQLAGAAIRQFGLRAEESDRVVSALAVATTKSALDFGKLQTALPIVGSVAANANVSLEDTIGLLGVLADRGLDASIAGTSLRNIFLEIAKRGLTLEEALQKINSAQDKNVKSLELFGKRAATAGVILAKNSGQATKLSESLIDVKDEMQEMAEKQLQTLSGRVKLLNSAWEGLILSIENGEGSLSSFFKTAIDFAADYLGVLKDLNEGQIQFNKKFLIGGIAGVALGLVDLENQQRKNRLENEKLEGSLQSTLDLIANYREFGDILDDVDPQSLESILQKIVKEGHNDIFTLQRDLDILRERLEETFYQEIDTSSRSELEKAIEAGIELLNLFDQTHPRYAEISLQVMRYEEALSQLSDQEEETKEDIKGTTEEVEAQAGSIEWLNKKISELKNKIKRSNDPSQIAQWKQEILEFQKELDMAESVLQRIDDMLNLQAAVRQGLTFGEELDPLPDRSEEFLQGSEAESTTEFQNLGEAQLLQSLQDQKITYEQFLVELNELRLRAEIKHWEEKMATLDEKSKEYLELQRKVAENEVELQRNTTDQITADRERMHDVLISGLHQIGEVTGQFLVDQHQSAEDFRRNMLLTLLDFISNSVLSYIPLILAKEVAEKSFAGIATAAILGGILKGAVATMRSRIQSEQSSSVQGYEEGGDTPSRGIYRDQSGKEVTGVVHTDEWVAPEWMNKHPKISPTIRALETIRQRGSFAEGGFAGTSPSFPDNITFGPAPAQDNSDIINELRALRASQDRQQKNIRAFVVLRDIENSQNELNSIINNASI